ncbi:thiamine biosynthesis protein ThiI [Alkalibacterium putridalgicola]|uniref:Probable tRNA sulfurtransferase n=1 Tax=Alkalibacterium putridalgicola TaxID=426703 RepID=A0A1H7QDZ0_9LACT|nr:tRNA uracil 4-sulfurtransferase ThiI [Alkalibacterium putridalgicola]GEK87965.1 putative tRNA sulfurtransferase [Alkalibacterium putridalgicola]SEL45517.1 thiamine biosynthesis protein ThiI [Alkalibacterium putridalgicola]
MEITELMIRYGELSTKGKNKKIFIKKLNKNVTKKLKKYDQVKVSYNRDRMHVKLHGENAEPIISELNDIFGIQSFSPIVRVEKSVEEAEKAVIELIRKNYTPGMSFKINTRRSDHSFEYDTNDINRMLGTAVEDAMADIHVQMKNPTVTVRVEVRNRGIFISVDTIQGQGGLPVGSSGKGMLMLSGGIDSPVAGYLSMKRGMEIEAVHFHSPPYTSPQALKKAKDLTAKLSRFAGEIIFIEVPFTEIQEQIKKEVPDEYSMTITRRMMMRLTDEIRRKRNGLAIVNGESLGQVASQTLESMLAINAVTSTPVLRPLISTDKNDIIDIAKQIDTYELAVQPFEDCCTIFAPTRPKTKPKLQKVEDFEKAIDVNGLMDRALEGMKIEKIGIETDENKEREKNFADLL